TVVNPTGDRIEVEMSTMFGYPATDSLGALHLLTPEAVGDSMPDASGWITFYPRRFVLEAGDRRLVRLRVLPPAESGIGPGEYWSRLVVTSRSAAPPIARETANPDVRIALAVEVRSVIPL